MEKCAITINGILILVLANIHIAFEPLSPIRTVIKRRRRRCALPDALQDACIPFRQLGTLLGMEEMTAPWPHAPTHQLSTNGTYFITAATYLKAHHFHGADRLRVLHRGLLTVARDFGWQLEAWAVFSNHYHFVARSPVGDTDADSLRQMLGTLHEKTAKWINRLDAQPGRSVWHNFWETRLTYEKSYRARLNYVHQNPVKHGLVPAANQYPWCSARWFERTATPAQVRTIYRFKTGELQVGDDYQVASDW